MRRRQGELSPLSDPVIKEEWYLGIEKRLNMRALGRNYLKTLYHRVSVGIAFKKGGAEEEKKRN